METKIIKQTFYKQVLPPECEFPNKILTKFLTSNCHDQAIWENEKRYSILSKYLECLNEFYIA